MARASLAPLLSHLRLLIGDPIGSRQVFSDDELALFVDRHPLGRGAVRLYPVGPPTVEGGSLYRVWATDPVRGARFYENDGIVRVIGSTSALSLTSADWVVGRFTLASGHAGPLEIEGSSYDLYEAAIEVLYAWLAKLKTQFNFSVDGQSANVSEKSDHIAALIERYKGMRPVTVSRLRRTDLARVGYAW